MTKRRATSAHDWLNTYTDRTCVPYTVHIYIHVGHLHPGNVYSATAGRVTSVDMIVMLVKQLVALDTFAFVKVTTSISQESARILRRRDRAHRSRRPQRPS